MAQPIVKLVLVRGYTEAYYQLSDGERDTLWTGVGDVIARVGAKMIGPYYDARWSNDKYGSFFLMEYPDVEAAIADSAGVEKLGLSRYMQSETILGIVRVEG